MFVYICFDVEDLVHPASDGVALDIATMLAHEGIAASMCVVGEKARLWERRGRRDVIAAMASHDVSLHTNGHSMHPVIAEYLADKGWVDGVDEAVRREGPGVRDIDRLFGRPPSSWGVPGSSWAPQIPAAMHRLGVPSTIYSQASSCVTGASWYAGQLNFDEFGSLPKGENALCDDAAFVSVLPALLDDYRDMQRRGFSCYGLFAAHPTRLLHREFWDRLNYAAGKNTDPADYRFAPRRTPEEYATGIRNLLRMIQAVRDLPGVELISVRELRERFLPDNGELSQAELHQLAQATADSGGISGTEPLASAGQTLDALARAVLDYADTGRLPRSLSLRTVLGPVDQAPALEKPLAVHVGEGVTALQGYVRDIGASGHLPATVKLGGVQVGPGPLLRALATVYLDLERGREHDRVTLHPGAEEPAIAASLGDDIYRRLPGWCPHDPDLQLDKIALHTKLQCWSLKPAMLKEP